MNVSLCRCSILDKKEKHSLLAARYCSECKSELQMRNPSVYRQCYTVPLCLPQYFAAGDTATILSIFTAFQSIHETNEKSVTQCLFFFFKLKDLGKDSTFLKSYVSFISIAFLFWLCIFPLDVKLHDVFVSQRYL